MSPTAIGRIRPVTEFSFTPDTHTYTLDGVKLPSVTTVLNEWVKLEQFGCYLNTRTGQTVPIDIFEAAGDRGNAVHLILKYLVTAGGVARGKLDAALVPYLDQLEAWKERFQPEPILVEKPLYEPILKYAGTPDIFCRCRGIKNAVLLDCKSGMRGLVGPQTSAYEPLVRKETKHKGMVDRYVLDVKPDGYAFEPCGNAGDWVYFKCKLATYNFERRMI